MRSFKVVDFKAPLKEIEEPTPAPTGTQVLIRVTPAAVTRIKTCVPVGAGVGSSISFKGALKSTTLKLLMASLPRYFCSCASLGRSTLVGNPRQPSVNPPRGAQMRLPPEAPPL